MEEISKLSSEEVEVSEQPLEEILGEVLGWEECMVVGDCWEGLGVGRTPKHFWNWEVVGVQRMPKVSEVKIGRASCRERVFNWV